MRKYLPLIVIVAIAAMARLLYFNSWSFSNDELSALTRLNFNSFGELIREGVRTDGHPALVQVFLYYYTHWFGQSATAVRLPFVVAGILSVVLHYLIARKWFSKNSAILSSIVMALLQFPVLYSQLARPYSFGLLWVLLSVFLWDKLLFRNIKNKWLVAALAGMSYALAMYTHYFSFLAVLIVGITGLFYAKKSTRYPYLFSGLVAVLLFIPHIPLTLHHLTIGGVGGWLAQPEPWWLMNHLKYIFNDSSSMLVLFILLMAVSISRTPKQQRWSKFHTISSVFFGVLFFTGFFYSLFVNAVIQHSTMLFGLPFILMLIFSWLGAFQKLNWLFIAVGLLLIIPPKGLWSFYKEQHFAEFKGVAQDFATWNAENDTTEIMNILYANDADYINFYLEKKPLDFNHVFHGQKGELQRLAKDSLLGQKEHLILGWTKPYRVQVYDIVRSHFSKVVSDTAYGSLSRITMFSKTRGEPYDSVFRKDKKLLFECFETFEQSTKCMKSHPENYISENGQMVYAPSQKFELQFNRNLEKNEEAVTEVEISGKIHAHQPLSKALIVCSLTPEKGKSKVWRSIPLSFFANKKGWNHFVFTPEIKSEIEAGDQLKIHFWNRENEEFLIDDLQIKLYGK